MLRKTEWLNGDSGAHYRAYQWSDGFSYTEPEPLEYRDLYRFYKLAINFIPQSVQELQVDKIEPIEDRLKMMRKEAQIDY